MRRIVILLLPFLTWACKTTADKRQPSAPDEDVSIKPDEMEPMRSFVLETRRILVAEYVKIEASEQFFAAQMGLTRDQQYVLRKDVRLDQPRGRFPAGTRRIEMTSVNDQTANVNPDYLPRVYFGSSGLEVRAYRAIVIYLVPVQDRERPLHIDVVGKNAHGDAKLWVSGRLQLQKPQLRLRSELIWSKDKGEYKHIASVG